MTVVLPQQFARDLFARAYPLQARMPPYELELVVSRTKDNEYGIDVLESYMQWISNTNLSDVPIECAVRRTHFHVVGVPDYMSPLKIGDRVLRINGNLITKERLELCKLERQLTLLVNRNDPDFPWYRRSV